MQEECHLGVIEKWPTSKAPPMFGSTLRQPEWDRRLRGGDVRDYRLQFAVFKSELRRAIESIQARQIAQISRLLKLLCVV